METLARFGYATKGALYLVVGGLAVAYALGKGGKLTDQQGAVVTLGREPFGQFLVWACAAGLGAYAAWRLIQAILDPESGKRTMKRAGQRIGYAVSGLVHAGLCVAVVQLALGSRHGRGGGKATYLAEILTWPGGALVVTGIGLAVIGVGVFELHQAYTARFMRKLDVSTMSAREQVWARHAGQAGLAAHGLIFGVVGWFLLRVAQSGRTNELRGLGGAMREIAARSHSTLVLGLVAVGLVGYAAYMFFTARYLRVGWDA